MFAILLNARNFATFVTSKLKSLVPVLVKFCQNSGHVIQCLQYFSRLLRRKITDFLQRFNAQLSKLNFMIFGERGEKGGRKGVQNCLRD